MTNNNTNLQLHPNNPHSPLPTWAKFNKTTTTHSQPTSLSHTCPCFSIKNIKCVFVLLLGLSVLLSAVFWLPPFYNHKNLVLDDFYKGHDIVATFLIQKPLSLLQDDISRLGEDIFDEIRVPTTKVVILAAENNDGLNATNVTFGVDPDEYNSNISSYARSLIRESFVSLVLKQSPLRLTESLFGEPTSFEVLKFVGGITVTPDQSTYPLQNVQIRFNFTLNFSIQQILDHFGELTSQLKSGLHLGPSENLHVSLTNSKGSTLAPQTTVQSSVVMVIGSPSTARSKQLAQTIKGSPTKNLGLNNTQFGRVKQISLSSYFNGSSGGSRTMTPSPAPLPHPPPQPHHHHHHHHQYDKQLPAKPPSPSKHSPAPHNTHNAMPPDCHSGYNRKKKNANNNPPLFPPVSQPVPSSHTHFPPPFSAPIPSLQPPRPPPPPLLPPPPPVTEMIPASSPFPNVVYAHTHPPSKSDSDADPPDMSPSRSLLQPSLAYAEGVALALRAVVAFVVVMTLQQN